jgi:hypothetical protein
MGDLASWAKQKGWWRTQQFRLGLFKSNPEQYAGLESGYWSVILLNGLILSVGAFFSPEQRACFSKVTATAEAKLKVMRRQGFVCNEIGVRRVSGRFWSVRSNAEKINESLQKIITLLHEIGVEPGPACIDCGAKDNLECYKVSHTILLPKLLCPNCVKEIKVAIESGRGGFPRNAALVKGEVL